jgi:hypothetical protein
MNSSYRSNDDLEFLKAFDVMKKLGFIRQKEKLSQSDVNLDKALFMDFWQEIEEHKQNIVTRELILAYSLAIQGFSAKDIARDKSLSKIYKSSNLNLFTI